jgi:uncharacterized protein
VRAATSPWHQLPPAAVTRDLEVAFYNWLALTSATEIPTTDTLEHLRDTKTILLTTCKRDGAPVPTPVSVACVGDRAYFRTWHKAWKTKRLANNPEVEVAPATLRGTPTGPAVRAWARLLNGDEARFAARALARRHRILQGVLVPLTHRLMRYRTMHYELRSID